jgi:hypothetical protein
MLRSLLYESIDLMKRHNQLAPSSEYPSLWSGISSIASAFASEMETKIAEAAAEDAKEAAEAAAKEAAEVAAKEAAAVDPRVAATNGALLEGVKYRMALPDDQTNIAIMICRQLYRRWTRYCKGHAASYAWMDDKTPSPKWVQIFLDNNLDWAKAGVTMRLNRLMWSRDAVDVSLVTTEYDEYDHDVLLAV